MKVLHLASFSGNIGDNASHYGLYKILNKLINISEIKKIEIRNFYKNALGHTKRKFDKSFVDECNKYDLVILGGGGYLDYWIPNSITGTTFDISEKSLGDISSPILFSSLGCVPGKRVPRGNNKKFIDFLNQISDKENRFLLLRNDGSMEHLIEHLKFQIPGNFKSILDNGFFYENFYETKLASKPYIALNVSDDQLSMNGLSASKMNKKDFYKSIAKIISSIINEKDIDIFFVPHIYKDIFAIKSVIYMLSEEHLRHKIHIGPYLQRDLGADINFSIYKNSLLSIGNRFHSNVCSIAMGKNAIGLSALDRVSKMFDSLGLNDSYVALEKGFEEKVLKKITDLADSNQKKPPSYQLNQMKNKTIKSYKYALKSLNRI